MVLYMLTKHCNKRMKTPMEPLNSLVVLSKLHISIDVAMWLLSSVVKIMGSLNIQNTDYGTTKNKKNVMK